MHHITVLVILFCAFIPESCKQMFVSTHYGGENLILKFEEGEKWKKVFGPVFMYVNSVADKSDTVSMWNDAKEQVQIFNKFFILAFPVFMYVLSCFSCSGLAAP